jgi:hypothetical protein
MPQSICEQFLTAEPVVYDADNAMPQAGQEGAGEDGDPVDGGRRRRQRTGLYSVHLSRLKCALRSLLSF